MTLPYPSLGGAFRGVPFLVPDSSLKAGRNTIFHQFPDSARRYGEDNGGHLPCFDITAIVHGRFAVGQQLALRAALDRRGAGTLRHPFFGIRQCAVDGEYTVSHSDDDYGVFTFQIPMKEVSIGPATSTVPAIPSIVAATASDARLAFIASIAGRLI